MGGGCVSAKLASHKKKLKSYQIPQGPLCKSSKSSWPWLLAALASQPTSIAGAGCKGFNPGRGKEEEDEGKLTGVLTGGREEQGRLESGRRRLVRDPHGGGAPTDDRRRGGRNSGCGALFDDR